MRLVGDGREVGGGVRLVRVSGGEKDNAIPVSAEAEVVTLDPVGVCRTAAGIEQRFRREFAATDPGLRLEAAEALAPMAMDAASGERVIRFLSSAPNGVQAMSRDIPNLVQTSLNLGILDTEPGGLTASFSVRSSAPGEKEALVRRLGELTGAARGTLDVEGDYPAWAYRADSPLRRRCEAVFREQYGQSPKIEAIHAGLECGILCGKLPGLDCVSLGPTMPDIHTPRERMSISSVQRVWAFLREVLRRSR